MRFILLVGIVTLICLFAVVRPRIGIYGVIWFTLMRPDILAWSDNGRYSMAMTACTLLGAAPYLARVAGWLSNRICLLFLLFALAALVSVVFAVNPTLALDDYSEFFRSCGVLLLIPILIENIQQLKTLLLVCAGSMGFIGLRFGVFGLIHGGVRLSQGFGFLDNNFLALCLAMCIPLCWYGGLLVQNKLARMALWGCAFCCVIGVILTFSRGGALAAGIAVLLIGLRSKRKILVTSLLILTVVPPAIYLAGESYMDRLSTISAPAEEASAEGRVTLVKIGWEIFKEYPVFGVGFLRKNQQYVMPNFYSRVTEDKDYAVKVLHNSYIQTLVGCGIVGFIPYLAMLIGSMVTLQGLKNRSPDPHAALIPIAFQTALITYMVGATFLSAVDNMPFLYIIIMSAAACLKVWNEQQHQPVLPLDINAMPAGMRAI